MQLESGHRLGPYEILDRIGAGGMGEVYRARDTRLSRNVAIKVLPSEFANDSRLRVRFEREAKTISSLNHPNICTLHDVGRDNGVDYLVLEYCQGTTLAHCLERGALPLEQVLQYGTEIADALSRAHRAGIVHRDLKPSNIMITKSGLKLLDFGLAKQRAAGSASDVSDTASLDGTLVGTVAYMAPEVLGGKEADARSDLFALGVVLYQMLTGKPAFSGTSTAGVMAAILEREPQPVRELKPDTPPGLEHVIQNCLAKNPDERSESAHDVAEELRWIRQAPTTSAPQTSGPRRVVVAVLALALVSAAATWMALSRQRDRQGPVRLVIPLPAATGAGTSGPAIAISPDGKRVAYTARTAGVADQIHTRPLDTFESVALVGTEGGLSPFFSPDGQWIGFFLGPSIRRVSVAGGTPQIVATGLSSAPRGAWWGADDTIYFSRSYSSGLWRVPASGGQSQRVTEPDSARGENSHRWPQVLPDGRHILMTIRTSQISSYDNARIAILSLDTGKWKVVLEGGTYARYIPTGDLLFARAGALYAATFDLKALVVRGTPRKVLDGVVTIPMSGVAEYAVSDDGDLIYLSGGVVPQRTELVAVDRSGRTRMLTSLNVPALRPRLSPDGRKIALNVEAANDDIWVYDLDSGVATRVTFDPGDEISLAWTPDGTRLVYSSEDKRLMISRVDGSGDTEELVRGNDPAVGSCSPDGEWVAYVDVGAETGRDVWLVPLKDDRKPRPWLRTRFAEYAPQFSPDGKWIVYAANDPSPQIYVRPASGSGGRWQLSIDGGSSPRWSSNGKEVFYRNGDELIAVPLTVVGAALRPGKPQRLFSFPTSRPAYDVMGDGFLMARDPSSTPWRPQQINVVLNWTGELH